MVPADGSSVASRLFGVYPATPLATVGAPAAAATPVVAISTSVPTDATAINAARQVVTTCLIE